MRRARTLLVLAVVCAAGPAAAQPLTAARSPLARGDVHGTLGWFNTHAEIASQYNDWYNRSLYGGIGLGWYWTDHLKSEVEFGATTAADLYASEPVAFSGHTGYANFQQKFSAKKLSAGQSYQFFRNRWFHPHVAAGLDLQWQTVERRYGPLFLYDPLTRQGRHARDPLTEAPDTSLHVRPFAAAGFKAYMTERGFFRSDLRVGIHSGVDEVLLRFGFGVDF